MAREAPADEKVVQAITDGFVPVLMDYDTEKEWAARHGVASIPMIEWTDVAGDAFATTEDVQSAARVLEDLHTTQELLAEFAKDE